MLQVADKVDALKDALGLYETVFRQESHNIFCAKIGVDQGEGSVSGEDEADSEEERLVSLLLKAMAGSAVDFTNTFLVLGQLQTGQNEATLSDEQIEELGEEELLERAGLLPLLEHAKGVYLKDKVDDIAAGIYI
jgi:uncharacterized protein YdiU (UPF0061 family)